MSKIFILAGIFVGYFVLRFGMVSEGYLRELIQAVGGLLLTSVLLTAFIIFGWKGGGIAVLLFWSVVTPIVELLIRWIANRMRG